MRIITVRRVSLDVYTCIHSDDNRYGYAKLGLAKVCHEILVHRRTIVQNNIYYNLHKSHTVTSKQDILMCVYRTCIYLCIYVHV